MRDIVFTIVFIALLVLPYIAMFIFWILDKTCIQHKIDMKNMSEDYIKFIASLDTNYFDNDIKEWCQLFNRDFNEIKSSNQAINK